MYTVFPWSPILIARNELYVMAGYKRCISCSKKKQKCLHALIQILATLTFGFELFILAKKQSIKFEQKYNKNHNFSS